VINKDFKAHSESELMIGVNDYQCRACNMCVLMCSFHHAKVFSLELSSIKVSINNTTGDVKWKVDSTCDLCKSEEDYMCIKYCSYSCLFIKDIK